jgi:hypothetical protein
MDVVEVIPAAVASADVTALVVDRVLREALRGIALRRRYAYCAFAMIPRISPESNARIVVVLTLP